MQQRPVVVGVDGSATSVEALRWALRHAAMLSAPVHVVVAWEQPVGYGAVPPLGAPGVAYRVTASTEPLEDVSVAAREGAEHVAQEALARAGAASALVPLESLVVEGPAGPLLVDRSGEAEVLVVGASGHGAFMGLVLGSVAQHVTTHARCPVVVVPAPASPQTS